MPVNPAGQTHHLTEVKERKNQYGVEINRSIYLRSNYISSMHHCQYESNVKKTNLSKSNKDLCWIGTT